MFKVNTRRLFINQAACKLRNFLTRMIKVKNRWGGTWTSQWKRKQLEVNNNSPHTYSGYVNPWATNCWRLRDWSWIGKHGKMAFQSNPVNWLIIYLPHLVWVAYLSLISTTLTVTYLLPYTFPLSTSWQHHHYWKLKRIVSLLHNT